MTIDDDYRKVIKILTYRDSKLRLFEIIKRPDY